MLAAALLLAGCSGGSDLRQRIKADLARYPEATFTQAGLRARYADATSLDYSVQHGTQVEYTAADGKAYLWYPGNRRVVTGEWKTITDKQGSGQICFRYPSSSYNPATGQPGGTWSCTRAADYIWGEEEYTRGDPFNLDSGTMPFVLPREKQMDFEYLSEPLGISFPSYL